MHTDVQTDMDQQNRILFVDDDPCLRKAYERILVKEGYQVEVAASAEDAEELIRKNAYAVAIVDYVLQERDGLSLLEELCEVQPNCQRILISGSLNVTSMVTAVNQGHICTVLQKPCGTGPLIQAVDEALAESERRRQQAAQSSDEALSTHLDECLRHNTIHMALQPVVSARSGSCFAYEALLRSTHPELSGPEQILAAADALDRIGDVADLVWSRAAECLQTLPDKVKLFVNLDPHELASPHLIERRAEFLRPWASRVVVELTEHRSVAHNAGWRESLAILEASGFDLAIDDLGAGYSSLSLLADLQPRFIKIDMSIVRNVHKSRQKQRLMGLLCRFAESTGALVIAEGIECLGEAEVARCMGADLLQGYLLGKPAMSAKPPIIPDGLLAPVGRSEDMRRDISQDKHSRSLRW